MNSDEIANSIRNGDLDPALDFISNVISERRKTLGRQLVWNLKPGDKVRIGQKCAYKYLCGRIGVVVRTMQAYVTIDLIEPVTGPGGKYWNHGIRVPGTLLERVTE